MPIYAYRCAACGHTQDILRKLSDPPLTVCPACAAQAFEKQVTAAGFQLKGSGWYVTDFRGNGTRPAEGGSASAGKDSSGGKGKGEATKPADTASAPSGATSSTSAASPGADAAG